MPIHDWKRVRPGTFHDFHHCWISEIRKALNSGILPEGYYAQAEQHSSEPHPDVLTLEMGGDEEFAEGDFPERPPVRPDEFARPSGGVAVAEHPPRVKLTIRAEEAIYERKANRVAIYHSSGHRLVAFVEVVSAANKRTEAGLRAFMNKMLDAINQGIHLLIMDLHPPRRHDPQGIHAAFWNYAYGESEGVTADKPLSLVAYEAVEVDEDAWFPTGYFEPVAIGQTLPDMPLFLQPGIYVDVPLEKTYLETWLGMPKPWKRLLEAALPDSSTNGAST